MPPAVVREVDTVIVGLGLAGSCLAWALRERGVDLLVIDREEAVTCSRIAAGLVTPVTGQRWVKTARLHEFLPVACDFYQQIERATGQPIFFEAPAVRLFVDELEPQFYNRRVDHPDYVGLFRAVTDWPAEVSAPLGGVELVPAARLDVARFLDLTRAVLLASDRYLSGVINPEADLSLREGAAGVTLPSLGLRCQRIIFCQGAAARTNPWFEKLAWNPAKGEVLVVAIPGARETRVVHRGLWIAPLGTNDSHGSPLYRVGATYDWATLDSTPTAAGREELEARLAEVIHRPFHVVSHQAAVRPILKDLNPVIGCLHRNPAVGFFNGLGSKGSLMAPFLARQFADHVRDGSPIEAVFDLNSRLESGG